ncbi:hypothetical protein COU97_02105 [Candidatus Shapirobacteria bacterium CG10_big_fil_rev_8_21_14_0_10_48_15]|uniref:Glycosyltransferase family 1 protein n=1 Tax=Candidatus Shapirobacteria bacterium CG10_big_fil_rev_8_21_14_0_10_48_15 TaxID=1974484 RepID=A0A2M8L6V6_9BACT|nr:MAG: hypothetical protein COU97_02105 [Candidatus Shapirobacteria bacterium CG10_big_fil_rev_8_21_14_0_10_48_15]
MTIGVDAGCLVAKKGGVYQTTYNLLTTLSQIDHQNHYELYTWQLVKHPFGKRMKNLVARPRPGWWFWGLPKQLACRRPAVFLGPAQALPAWSSGPTVVIVHDLGFEHWPKFYPQRRRLRRLTKLAVAKASRIVAVSQATKRDLVQLYQVPTAKIKVAWEGCDQKIFCPSPKPKKKAFLFVGAPKPSKNIAGLLAGFACFCQTRTDYELWLAGGNFAPLIGDRQKVKNLGLVNQKKLVSLYQQATALVSPAFYEGFGLPLVEALACGCPVVAGNTGSQPEVVGRAGLLVDPSDPKAIGQAMWQVITRQKQLVQAGLKRAALFSWQKFARQVMEAINEVKN